MSERPLLIRWWGRRDDLLVGAYQQSPRRSRLIAPLVAGALLASLPWTTGNVLWTRQALLIIIYALVASGLVISFGYAGELQFGQVGMMAVAAYVTGILSNHGLTDIILLGAVGGVSSAIVGAVLALAALRVGGWSLGMVSFFLVLIVPEIVSLFSSVTGGEIGLSVTSNPTLIGMQLSSNGFYLVAAIALIAWYGFSRNLLLSPYGSMLRISKENVALAGAVGLYPFRVKVIAYTLGSFPAGIAGTLFAFANSFVSPSSFSLDLSIAVLAAVILGGSESLYGAFIGAAILVVGPFSSNDFSQYSLLVYGAFLLAVAVLFRAGLSGIARALYVRVTPIVNRVLQRMPATYDRTSMDEPDLPKVGTRGTSLSITAGQKARGTEVVNILGLSKSFGRVKALDDVDFVARSGEVTALIGTNGSGKTTLLNILSGFLIPDSGTVRFYAQNLPAGRPERISRIGVGRTFQTPAIPVGMTVADVASSGRFIMWRPGALASGLGWRRVRRRSARESAAALETLDLFDLGELAAVQARQLPLGSRRLLEVARGLSGGAKIILLDEPAAGLSPEELGKLRTVLEQLKSQGIACILVEHNVGFVRSVADRIYVLHFGHVIAVGTSDEISLNEEVKAVYMGRSITGGGGRPDENRGGETQVNRALP